MHAILRIFRLRRQHFCEAPECSVLLDAPETQIRRIGINMDGDMPPDGGVTHVHYRGRSCNPMRGAQGTNRGWPHASCL